MKVEIPDFLIYAVLVVVLCLATLHTGLAVACDVFGSPVKSVVAVGYATDLTPSEHSVTFTFRLNDGSVVGRYTTDKPLKANETLILIYAQDGARLPLLYEGRRWFEVWSQQDGLVYTSEYHTPLLSSLLSWGVVGGYVTVIKYMKRREVKEK